MDPLYRQIATKIVCEGDANLVVETLFLVLLGWGNLSGIAHQDVVENIWIVRP